MTRRHKPSFRIWALAPLVVLVASTAFAGEAEPKVFKEDELASLLAPIALYPDVVVTQVLMASTYPLEVVSAHRWLEQNTSLKGEALAAEAKKQSWDPSVQGLTAMPDVLKMMDEKLEWTQKVGDAFLAQQKEVMDTIQELRAKAKAEGNLKSDEHMKVTTEPAPTTTAEGAAAPAGEAAAPAAASSTAPQVIVIESADPEVIYVPTYNPVTVYGAWGYPAYPPYYWPPPVGYPGSGFWWGVGVGISVGFWGGCWDNHHADWHGGSINVGEINIDRGDINIDRGDRNQINTGDRGNRNQAGTSDRASAGTRDKSGGQKWSHNPEHRKGVSYRDNATASKFDRASTNAGSRDAYRGRTSTGATDMRGSGGSAGSRDLGSASRPSPSTGQRSSTTPRSSSRSPSTYGGSQRSGSSSAFGGMSSGSRAGSYGARGGASRGGGGGASRGGGGGRRR